MGVGKKLTVSPTSSPESIYLEVFTAEFNMTINRRTGSHGSRAGQRLIPRLPAPSPSQLKARSILGFYKLGKYVAHQYKQERRLRRDPDGGKDDESYCPGIAKKWPNAVGSPGAQWIWLGCLPSDTP